MRKELVSITAAFLLSTSPARAQEGPIPPGEEIVDHVLDYKSKLEDNYTIEIVDGITPWDKAHLELLDEILSVLPSGLYHPSENGRKVRFELTPFISMVTVATCICGTIRESEDADVILFTPFAFEPLKPEEALRSAAHELTHRRMPTIALTNEPSYANRNSYTSPWYEKINTILGGDFSQRRHEIHVEIMDKWLPIKKNLDTREKKEFYSFTHSVFYGLGKTTSRQPQEFFDHPIELVATLSEHFVSGKGYFFRMYNLIFEEDTVSQLYDFIRAEVFDGWEYENFVPIDRGVHLLIPYPSISHGFISTARSMAKD